MELPVGLSMAVDELGRSISLDVDLAIYPLAAVLKAAYWYTDSFYLFLHHPNGGTERVRVEFRAKDARGENELLAQAGGEFANALLDHAVRQAVIFETNELRDALVRKALGEGRAHRDLQTLADPHAIPLDGTFDGDPRGIRCAEGGHGVAN